MKSVFNKKRVVYILIFFAVTCAAFFSNPSVYKYFTDSKSSKLRFETGTESSAVVYGRDILLVNNEGISAVDRSGREVWGVSCAATTPVVEIKNKYIMHADLNGKAVNLYKKDRLETQIKTEREILSARMNKNGYIAVVTDESGYRGMVTVYSASGREVFRWHSGSGYIADVALLSDNSIAVAQILTDGETVRSKVLMPDMKGGGETKCVAELDGLAVRLSADSGSKLCVICDKTMYAFKANGKELFKIDFQGRALCGYDIKNKGNMVLEFEDGLGNTVLESYSAKGVLRGSYSAGEKLGAFAVSGECILAAGQQSVVRLNPEGKVKGKCEISHNIDKMAIFSGRRRFIAIGGNGAELLGCR